MGQRWCAPLGVAEWRCGACGQAIGEEADVESSSADTVATEEGYHPVFFEPRSLKNLVLVDEMESLCPIMDMQARRRSANRPASGRREEGGGR